MAAGEEGDTCCWPGPPTPNGIGMATNGEGRGPEDPVGREDKGRATWRYSSAHSPAASIEAGANDDLVEMNGEREPEPEPVCTGVRGG